MEAVVSVVFQLPSCVWLFATQWTAACQPPCPSPSCSVCPSSCSLYQWCHPAISSSDALFSFCPPSFPASRTFPTSHLFTSDDYNTSASASVLPVNIQGWWSPCCPRDFQESSPEPQFEGINSSAFRLLYDPALTTVHDPREDHSLDCVIKAMTDLTVCWKAGTLLCRQRSVWSVWRLRGPKSVGKWETQESCWHEFQSELESRGRRRPASQPELNTFFLKLPFSSGFQEIRCGLPTLGRAIRSPLSTDSNVLHPWNWEPGF